MILRQRLTAAVCLSQAAFQPEPNALPARANCMISPHAANSSVFATTISSVYEVGIGFSVRLIVI